MKNKIIVALLCVSASLTKVTAQEYPLPLVIEGKATDAQFGIAKDMVYESILETNLTQKELITKISKGLIENGFLDPKDFKIDEITSKQKQFIIKKAAFRGGTFAGKGKSAIAKRLKSPAYLKFNVIFDFDESGKVRMQFTNFDEVAFIRINDQGQFHFVPSMGSMMNPSIAPTDARHDKLIEMEQKIMKTGTGFGKAMSFIEKGNASARITLDAGGIKVVSNNGIKDNFKKLLVTLDEEWKVLDKAVKDKVGIWIDTSSPQFMDLYQTVNDKQKKIKEITTTRIGEKNLIVVDNDRFDNYFKDLFNDMFIWSAMEIKAKNFAVKKDGTLLYNAVDNYELMQIKK